MVITKRILIIVNISNKKEPWWLQYAKPYFKDCIVDIVTVDEGGTPLLSRKGIYVVVKIVNYYFKSRKYNIVITLQDSWSTFIFAFLERTFSRKYPKHLLLEFITTEKRENVYSRFKYLFLNYSLKAVYKIFCSARSEIDYYKSTIKLKNDIFFFNPLYCDPKFVNMANINDSEDYIISAGRTKRDYDTLIEAVRGLDIRLVIVASRSCIKEADIPQNVTVYYDLEQKKLVDYMTKAKFVVITLRDTVISVGQSVLLISMALGKATIVTKAPSIVDYVEDGSTAILVDPESPKMLRESIVNLYNNDSKIQKIGTNAKRYVKQHCNFNKYIENVSFVIKTTLNDMTNRT